jgi:hypothetical protein
VISAFHPVLALADFALGYAIARQSIRLVREVTVPAVASEKLEPSSLP